MKHFIELIYEAAVSNWHKPVVCDYPVETFEFADVATHVAKLRIIFRKLNIKPGDKIAICGRNSARWAIAYLATVTYRAVAVPILTGFTPETLESLIEHSDSVLIFTERNAWKGIKTEKMPKLMGAIALEDFSEIYSLENRLSTVIPNIDQLFRKKYPQGMKRKFLDLDTGDIEELVTISYTSGTTSSPKGIMLSAKNISSNVNFGQKRIQIKRNSTMVSMLPLAHLYGLTFELLYPMASGCSIYFLGKTPSPTLLLGAFKEVQPTMMITVPLVIEKIIQKNVIPIMEKPLIKIAMSIPFINGILRSQIKEKIMEAFGGNMNVIIVGGAAISGPVEILLKQLRIPYTVGYGMTECGPLIGYEDWYDFAIRSCGKPVDGMMVRIDSSNQRKEIGEIQVKGDNVMLGYYKNEAATSAAFTSDGWMKTGDLGIIDRYGNIYIKGRSKNMILTSNGQNIYPEEIEDLLNTMPHVRESIVISRDKHIIAIVAVDNDDAHPLTKSELQTIMKSNLILLNHKLPSYSQVYDIEMLDDDFERTPKNSIKRFLYK